MIPFVPGRRRPEDPESRAHARATRLAAERLSEPLAPEDEAWLGGHLHACEACRAVAAAYEAESALLRSQPLPEAPRDLWARTAAAIEADGARSFRRPSLIPLGALSGALVVAVVVGASILSSPAVTPVQVPSAKPLPSTAAASTAPVATPFPVTAGEVGWVLQQPDGTYDVAYAPVSEVCPAGSQPDCPALADPSPGVLKLQTKPSAIVGAPDSTQLVVLDANTATTGGSVYVVAVPTAAPSPGSSPSAAASPAPTASASASPAASPAPTASSSSSSAPSESPTASDGSVAIAQDVIVVGQAASYSPDGRWFAFSARPSDGSQGPDIYVWSRGDGAAHPVTMDHRSVFAGWSGSYIIGSRAVVVAADASPSPTDPTATAQPAASPSAEPAASAEPTEPEATPSAGTASPSPTIATAASFVLDPATGAVADLPGEGIWRPVVDPSGAYAVYWHGTLQLAPNGVDWLPDTGRLVVARWTAADIVPTASPSPGPDASPSASPSPSPSTLDVPSPSPSPSPSLSPSPSSSPQDTASPSIPAMPSPTPIPLPATLSDGPVRDWDAHWDDTGTRIAVWIADPVDATVGTLSLHTLDRTSDALDPNGPLLAREPALAGFSLGSGRLAWATPPGQGGEGSRVDVLAWSGDSAGQIQSLPDTGQGSVVVIR